MHYQLSAGGRVWDKCLQKLASYKELIHRKDDEISKRWMTGGKNQFGRLFQGFKPNEVEGLDVLEWIPKTAVPTYKTVTYPSYNTTVRPEKDENIAYQLQPAVIKLIMKET